jgi:hypothetical protein
MAHHAAVAGTGRGAVLGVLERFLEEVDAEAADAAALARWRAVDQVIQRFERILAGQPARPREPRPRPGATVLSGPWSAGTCSPATGAPKATRRPLPAVPPRD